MYDVTGALENVRILIAEDDYLVSEMLKGLLEEAGHTIAGEAANGIEALEMTQSLRPDVVLMDIRMPHMDGLEATKLIFEQCPTPVVVLTAYETEGLVQDASTSGVGAYLVKPPKLREIERAITIAMARFDDMMALHRYAGELEQRVQERTVELRAKCARLEAVLDSTNDGIVLTNAEGEIVQTNPVAQTWLNQTLSPLEAKRLREKIRELVRRVEDQPHAVLELTGLDLEVRAAPISRLGVEDVTAVVSIHDASHLKALGRMKSRFITNMSHEFRTPIATLKLVLGLMQRSPPEKWGEYLDTMRGEVDWLTRLMGDIVHISRIDTGRVEMNLRPVPINELLRTAAASLSDLAQKQGVTLQVCPSESEVLVLVDPDLVIQALDKLLKNGIVYTPEGGQVEMAVRVQPAEGRTWAVVTISDTGIGIPEDDLPHVFDRFFRGERPRDMQVSGTGLGLPIAKEIVELHGGSLAIQSEVDQGTTITVELPLANRGLEMG